MSAAIVCYLFRGGWYTPDEMAALKLWRGSDWDERHPYTERALLARWERGESVPTEWAAYFCGLEDTGS